MRGPRRTSASFSILLVIVVTSAEPTAASAQGGFPIATLDVEDAWVPPLELHYWMTDASDVTIPVSLDRTTTSGGFLAWTAWIGGNPTNGSMLFPIGVDGGSYSFSFGSAAGVAIAEGWELTDVLTYVHSGDGIDVGIPNQMHVGRVVQVGSASRHGGLACFIEVLLGIFCDVFPPACPSAALGGGALDTLRRYRDEVLASTTAGQFYVDKYAEHSLELTRAALREPDFFARFVRAEGPWVSALTALVNGLGDNVTVMPQMQADLLSLLDSLEANGSPDLAADLAFERQRLQLDTIAGLTIGGFQDQVETLGGVTSVEPLSWGKVKSRYR
jgi:hypothetical protein